MDGYFTGLDDDSNIMIGVQGVLSESEFGVLVKILPLDEEGFQRFCEDSDIESDDSDDEEDEEAADSFQSKKFSFKKLKQLELPDSVVAPFQNCIKQLTVPLKDRLESLKDASEWREERVRGLIAGQIDIFNKLHQALTSS